VLRRIEERALTIMHQIEICGEVDHAGMVATY
jgi:hypothetical protein